jgi:hypothetical protein
VVRTARKHLEKPYRGRAAGSLGVGCSRIGLGEIIEERVVGGRVVREGGDKKVTLECPFFYNLASNNIDGGKYNAAGGADL